MTDLQFFGLALLVVLELFHVLLELLHFSFRLGLLLLRRLDLSLERDDGLLRLLDLLFDLKQGSERAQST